MVDKESRGNIKIEYNSAVTGLNMDNVPSQIDKGRLTYALNAAVENFDANSVNYQNELGNELCLDLPENFVLIGHHYINEKRKHIFFITNPDTGDSQIGYMDNNDCQYHILIDASCLNFDIHHPIHKVVHRITNCSTEIYWTDGYNPRRYLDIENIPYIIKSGTPVCDPIYTSEIDCNQLNIQPNFNVPLVSVTDVLSTGDLVAGTYQFTVQYGDPLGNPFTSYYSVTNPVPIADTTITTLNFNYPVGKSIVVDVTNLDTTGLYKYFNLAVIKTVNAISSVELVGTYAIENGSKQITYTGQNVTNIRLSTSDIFEKFPYYEIADDLTTAQDILIWSNLTSIDRINYQQIANKIRLQWETWRIPATEDYADELNATNLKSYLRDEIYPFELQFILTNGKETDGFHIPGRLLSPEEKLYADIPETDPDFIGVPQYYEGGIGYSPYWKIYNTAKVEGFSPEYSADLNYKGTYQFGEFAYWESTEEYPCNENVWGDLAGQKIRHHKFPDVLVSPIFESKVFTNRSSMVMGNDAIFPIGVKVNTNQIRALIESSNLTTQQKSEIVGFRILRGNRSTNKSVVAKGILRNVNKYERDEREYYFPNYPYNDLNPDVFLNSTNNAYADECEQFTVNITSLVHDAELNEDVAEISYIDCNTNKLKKEVYKELKEETICAIGKPTIIRGNGTITYMNYDIWKVSVGYNSSFPSLKCAGWRVRYNDVTNGITDKWVGPSDVLTLNVVIGTKPECVEGCKETGACKDKEIIEYVGSSIADSNCVNPEPLPEITEGRRLVFNSPETSFGKPFLGDILKLESIIFGKGKAHFTEVRDNAKYRLISKEAQQRALDSSAAIASITTDFFNVQAMFAAYQAYLTIYINGITRKNYAYSFNSIASYDYSHAIPNGEGIKQRNLDIARYLIPSVVSVGDDLEINNWQRESSVYLKTDESLPFPDSSPNMLSGDASILTERSRFTISEAGNCNNPGADEDIEVVSYYASIKKDFINQWGQIYSYETVSTGFEYVFGRSTGSTVFGGDTYINRFAFKTKLPFFIDNRIGAADDSDIFYDEIGNVGYPKYWHSARSILTNYIIPEENTDGKISTLVNFISYKAHNFDCSNEAVLTVTETTTVYIFDDTLNEQDSERTYYDGYFYLFAYGIPNFYCESSYNVDLRQAYNNKEGDFWPHVSNFIPDDWLQENFVSIINDNTYYYNTTYSKQNKENYFSHLPADWEEDLCFTNYPFRAVYSDLQSTDSDNRVNNWRIYRATSYFDFPQNYGNLTSLDGIQNRAILARFENKTLLYNNLLTLDTSNPQAAYLGNQQLFRGAPPIDFADTDLGYVGSQHKMLLKVPQGQISADAKRGSIFLIQGTQATDISGFGSGMNRFFTDHLPFKILEHFPDIEIDNHFNGIGLHAVYDSKFERIIITKLDYEPISDIEYENYKFYVTENRIRKEVKLTDSDYFYNRSWTVSFNFNTKSWISFHSYLPNFYIAENNFFYSGLNDCCGDFDFIASEIPELLDCFLNGYTTSCEDQLPDCVLEGEVSEVCTTTTSSSTLEPCYLDGDAIEICPTVDCILEGEAIQDCATTTTTTTECTRPDDLEIFTLITGYTVDETIVDSTTDKITACSVMIWMGFNDVTATFIQAQAYGIYIGSHLYLVNGTNDCECVPDGWYFTDETMFYGYVFHVENCIITEIYKCMDDVVVETTTTTTTEAPILDCELEGEATELCTTTTTTLEPTTTTTTTIPCTVVIEFEGYTCDTTTTTTTQEVTTSTTTTETPTTTTTTTVESTTSTTTVELTTTTTTLELTTTTTTTTLEPTTSTTTSSSTSTTTTTTTVEPTTTTTTTVEVTTTSTTTLEPTTTTTTSSTTIAPTTTTTTTTIFECNTNYSIDEINFAVTTTTTTTTEEVSTTTTTTTTTSTSTLEPTTTTTTLEVTTTSTTTVEPTTSTTTIELTTTTTTTEYIAPNLDTCDMLLSGGDDVMLYSVNPSKYQSLQVPGYVQGNDIANSSNKLWLLDSTSQISEYDITYVPFSAVFNKSTTFDFPKVLGQGIFAIDDNTIITSIIPNGDASSYASELYVIDMSQTPPFLTYKFDLDYTALTESMMVSGDIILTNGVSPKLIVTTEDDFTGDTWLYQYDWNTGAIEIKKSISHLGTYRPFGLAVQNGKLYLFEAVSNITGAGDIYEIPLTAPYEPIFIEQIPTWPSGASQRPDCIDVEMVPDPAYTPEVLPCEFGYGLLYNGFAIDDVRGLANTGWHISTQQEWEDLRTFIGGSTYGGKLKTTGTTYWDSPNTSATNDYGFNAVGSSSRSTSGVFATIKRNFNCWTAGRNYVFRLSYNSSNLTYNNPNPSYPEQMTVGNAVRLVKDSTTLLEGEEATYVGNNGVLYRTICINSKEWLADNLKETKFNNGDIIPYSNSDGTLFDDSQWAALREAACCAHNNNIANVGCNFKFTGTYSSIIPATTTTTTEEATTTTTTEETTPTTITTTTTIL